MTHPMKVDIFIVLLGIVMSVPYGLTQTPAIPAERAPALALLEEWKNAVLSGNPVELKRLYSTTPATRVTLVGKESTTDADVAFWLGLQARSLKADVKQTSSPQPGMQVVLFEAEVQSAAAAKSQSFYVTELQAWRQQGDAWRLVAVQRTNAARLQQPLNDGKDIYPADVDARREIKEAEEKAGSDHKRVLLVFGANWCYDCHVLDLAFQRPDFASVMSAYEVVHVDIGPNGKKNADLVRQFQVPLDKGVPALAVLESDGRVVVSQKNGEFENARAMTPEALLEFLEKWKPKS